MSRIPHDPLVDVVMQLPPFEREVLMAAVTAYVRKSVPLEQALDEAKRLIDRHRAGETLRLGDIPAGWQMDLSGPDVPK